MSGKELRRVHVLHQAMDKQVTQMKAGAVWGLTARQVRRLLQRVRAEGAAGLAHHGGGVTGRGGTSESGRTGPARAGG
jgi:hypothetical protein